MLIYNTTYVCEDKRLNEFLAWLNAETIPQMLDSDIAYSPQLCRVVPIEEQTDKITNISLQFRFNDVEALERWIRKDMYVAHCKIGERFGQSVLFFSTVLEVLPLSVQN